MSNRLSFTYISKDATRTYNSWSNKQVVEFHYFNPNGLFQEMAEIRDEMFKMVEDDLIPSGWLNAYDFAWEIDKLRELSEKGRVNKFELASWLQMTRDQIAKVKGKIQEVKNPN